MNRERPTRSLAILFLPDLVSHIVKAEFFDQSAIKLTYTNLVKPAGQAK